MSQGGNEENELQRQLRLGFIDPQEDADPPLERLQCLSTIMEYDNWKESIVRPCRVPLPDSMDQNRLRSTEMSQGRNDEEEEAAAVAVKRLTSTIVEKITRGAQKIDFMYSSACIYTVPENLRMLNHSAYTPHLIAIGLLHREDIRLKEKPMEQVKMYYAKYLVLRLTEGIVDEENRAQKNFEVLQECVKEMKKVAYDAQKSYGAEFRGNCEMEEVKEEKWMENVLEMMVFDGCFILELLYSYYDLMKEQEKKPTNGGDSGNPKASSSIQQPREGEDSSKSSSSEQVMADLTYRKKEERRYPTFESLWIANNVRNDLLLLENQIPFFVLEILFKLTVEKIPNCPHKRSLTDYVLFYFQDTMSPPDNSKNSGSATATSCGSPNDCVLDVSGNEITRYKGQNPAGRAQNYYHILHLLHDSYLPSVKQESGPKTKFSEFTLSAANLEYAGVKFKPLSGNNLFDVKFNEDKGLYWWCRRASFEIPTIGIHDPTEPFLRNLIAFEQCCPGVSQHFTSYAFLMGMLINSQADFQVLKDAKVIKSYLGADEDTLNLFNKLCKEVAIANFYFADPCSRAYNYSQHGWPKFMAYLKRTYFGSPWAFIGFCVAFIAFGMSVIQFGWSFLKKSG